MVHVNVDPDAPVDVAADRAAVRETDPARDAPAGTAARCRIDLGIAYHVTSIALRPDSEGVVELSADGSTWVVVHQFEPGNGAGDDPLTIHLNQPHLCRYVRVLCACIADRGSVQVFATPQSVRLARYFAGKGLDLARIGGPPPIAAVYRDYTLSDRGSRTDPSRIDALRIRRFGRFGNKLIQIVNAIVVAKRLGIGRIYVDDLGLPDALLAGPRTLAGGIEFVNDPPPETSDVDTVLYGNFWNLAFLAEPRISYAEIADAIRNCLKFAFRPSVHREPDTVVLNLRGGDVFAFDPPPYRNGQPPLSYYTMAIEHISERHGARKVVVVYEDRSNPVVDALEKYLSSSNFQYRMQSSSLENDIETLSGAEYLVIARGTFALMAGILSPIIKMAVYFHEGLLSDWFAALGVEIAVIEDVEGGYTPHTYWGGTPEEYALMLTYPDRALKIIENQAVRSVMPDGAAP